MFLYHTPIILALGAIILLAGLRSVSIQQLPDQPVAERRAFATYLSSEIVRTRNRDRDPEFDAVRSLIYQILHQPSTRTGQNTSMLVLVSPDVSKQKQHVLEAEGAEVVTVQHVTSKPQPGTMLDNSLIPLRLLEQTQFDRILFLQPYLLLTKPLDAIWEEHAANRVQCTRKSSQANHTGEAIAPESYLFATVPSRYDKSFNSGFWIVRPDQLLYKYYESVLEVSDKMGHQSSPLRGILNYAHRKEGNMPWIQLSSTKWHSDVSTHQDLLLDCITVYNDFWLLQNPSSVNKKFLDLWWETQGHMTAFWKEHSPKSTPLAVI